jgi:hypothetical protein
MTMFSGWIALGITLTYPVFTVAFDMDPLSIYFNSPTWIYEDASYFRFVLILVRLTWLGLVVYMNYKMLAGVTLPSILTLYILLITSLRLTMVVKWLERPRNVWHVPCELVQSFRLHKMMRILGTLFHEAYFVMSPLLLLLGSVIIIVSSYASIRMHSKINILLYVIMPTMSILTIWALVLYLTPACKLNTNSRTFLQLSRRIARGKLLKCLMKAELEVRIQFGNTFYAKRSTNTTFLDSLINYTVTALLSK